MGSTLLGKNWFLMEQFFLAEVTLLRREAKGWKIVDLIHVKYSRLSLSQNRRDPLKHFEISVLRYIRFVVLRKKQFEQPNFTNDCVI